MEARDAASTIARIAAQDLMILPQAAVLEFTCAAVQSLDQYSSYLTGDQLDDVFSQIEGNFVGLGIELKADNDTLLIVNVIPGGPAEQAGIVADDRIVEVDGMTTREVSTDAAADMLKGEELSYVNIVLQAPDGTLRRLRIQRRRVDVPSVQDATMIDPAGGVAYMKLTSFQKTTSRDVDNALWALHRQGMRALIIDVRGNPGGLLNASVEVADKFLTGGTIVSTRGRSAREDYDYQAHQVGTWRVPLVVLIDRRFGQCQRDLCRGHPRPSTWHGGRAAQLRQGECAGDLPVEPVQGGRSSDDRQVLLAQRSGDQQPRGDPGRAGAGGIASCRGAAHGRGDGAGRPGRSRAAGRRGGGTSIHQPPGSPGPVRGRRSTRPCSLAWPNLSLAGGCW